MDKTSLEELKKSHTPEAIRRRLSKQPPHSYLKDFIYGAIDGTVTTFAIVAGVAGANLSIAIVIILGLCNLLADGFSMAVSNFLGTRAEQELRFKAEKEEQSHIQLFPEGEKEEIRQIFAAKGFYGQDLEKIVSVITSDVRLWLKTMMQEELGLGWDTSSPLKAAIATFTAFLTIGFFPLVSFIAVHLFPTFEINPFFGSIILTGCVFFLIGALKSQFVGRKWYLSGLETLTIGGSAALLAYLVGLILRGIH